MFSDEINKKMDQIPFTKHVIRCSITVALYILFFRVFGITFKLEEIKLVLYCMIGFDLVASYITKTRAYHLRSALAYCLINFFFCISPLIHLGKLWALI